MIAFQKIRIWSTPGVIIKLLQNFPLNKILQLADFCNFVIITFLPRNLLLRKILRKYAMKKVPNMRMAESRAVFACGWSPCASASSCKHNFGEFTEVVMSVDFVILQKFSYEFRFRQFTEGVMSIDLVNLHKLLC